MTSFDTILTIIERGGSVAVAGLMAVMWWYARKDTDRERTERHEKEALFRKGYSEQNDRMGRMAEALTLLAERLR